jgi:hypothetical protein
MEATMSNLHSAGKQGLAAVGRRCALAELCSWLDVFISSLFCPLNPILTLLLARNKSVGSRNKMGRKMVRMVKTIFYF